MIDFLKNKGIKAYQEIMEIAEQPNLLFSNDSKQMGEEANYNLYTIQSLNKLIKKKRLTINELVNIFRYIEASWEVYMKKYYSGKSFVFYMWGDRLIPAIRISVISYFEGFELPFGCSLNHVDDMQFVFKSYIENAQFDGLVKVEEVHEVEEEQEESSGGDFCLTVYSKIINC